MRKIFRNKDLGDTLRLPSDKARKWERARE